MQIYSMLLITVFSDHICTSHTTWQKFCAFEFITIYNCIQ